ncbi:MAG TPA: 50S ribosomal protein L25 [Phycisphaerae bacterium]|nr:50S ribosomal protein L25 [Phycisphaerae bacterium]HRR87294.1 50S ribosomal protein L25 [Phycisphaerae bacterium]
MEIAQLKAETRQGVGSAVARRLRKAGKLPAVLYGHGQRPENLVVSAHDVQNLLEHKTHVLELLVGSGKQQVLIKDVQFDHLGLKPIHVDFARVSMTERVEVSVPLDYRGTPVGVTEGGTFDAAIVDIEIECLVTEIPESIRVNVADLKIGDFLHVKDLVLPEGVKPVTPGETIICSVRAKAAEEEVVAAAEAEEGPAEPEIIGRKEKAPEQEEESESK